MYFKKIRILQLIKNRHAFVCHGDLDDSNEQIKSVKEIDLIKIDVEGHESQGILGLEQTII